VRELVQHREGDHVLYSTAATASWAATANLASRVAGAVRPVLLTLARRMSMATIAITEPQIPSKKAARNYFAPRKQKEDVQRGDGNE